VQKISDELINELIRDVKGFRDPFFEEAINTDVSIANTFGSTYPEFMSIQRPNETESQKKYRKDYFEATGNPVSGFLGQIEKQLDKVFTSEEFKIVYNEDSTLGNENLREYLEESYYNGSKFIITFKDSLKKAILTQPNSVLSVIPNEQSGDYPNSYFLVASADKVLYYKANEFCILESELKSEKFDAAGNSLGYTGEVYYLFDSENYCIVKNIGVDSNGKPNWTTNKSSEDAFRKHGFTNLPCKKIGTKIVKSTEDGHELRDSELADSLGFLRKAIMNSMDEVIEHNFHVASQEWALATTECGTCHGTGKVKGEGKAVACGTCNGAKLVASFTGDGMNKMIIPASSSELGGRSDRMPTIMGGFIERSETGAKIFSQAFERNMQLALRPFGLEHLLEVPYNQSGSSKSYDMQEGYAFISSMSDHIGMLLKMTINSIAHSRYKALGVDKISNELPEVVLPKSFNLSNSYTLLEKIKEASTYHLPELVVARYTRLLIETESGKNSEEALEYSVRSYLDPLPTANYNEKLLSRAILGDLRHILSLNIQNIMKRAIIEKKSFLKMDYKEQLEIVNTYAQEILDVAKVNLDAQQTIKQQANVVESAGGNLN
jgi:hypothetical protein